MGWVKLLGGVSRKSAKQTSRSPLAAGEDERCVLLLQGLSLSCSVFGCLPWPQTAVPAGAPLPVSWLRAEDALAAMLQLGLPSTDTLPTF